MKGGVRVKAAIPLRHWDTNDRAKIDRESCRPSGAANKVPCIASWRCNVIRIKYRLAMDFDATGNAVRRLALIAGASITCLMGHASAASGFAGGHSDGFVFH